MIGKYSFSAQGIVLALFAMLTFSVNDGIFKHVLKSSDMQNVVFAGYGFSLLAIGAYGALGKLSFSPQSFRHAFISGLLFLLEQSFFIYALKHLPIAELFVVVLATPVAVLALSSLLLKEHLQRREVLAVMSGFAGAFLVVASPLFINGNFLASGLSFAWIAAILNVATGSSKIIYLRKYCQNENAFSLSFISITFVTIFYATQLSSHSVDISSFDLILLALGGGLGAAGCIAYINAFQRTKAALVSATQYSQIVWAVLMGVFIFEEALTGTAIIGSLLILASGYSLYVKKR